MSHPVVFFEIAGKDGKRLQDFYASVFGWAIDTQRVPGYGYIDTGVPGAIEGGIHEEKDVPSDKVLYIGAPEALSGVSALKGRSVGSSPFTLAR